MRTATAFHCKAPRTQEDSMDPFFIIPIIILLALLALCVIKLKDDLSGVPRWPPLPWP